MMNYSRSSTIPSPKISPWNHQVRCNPTSNSSAIQTSHVMPYQLHESRMKMTDYGSQGKSRQSKTDIKLPPPLDKDLRDKNGCVLKLDLVKKIRMEEATHAVFLHFNGTICSLSIPTYLKKFKQFLRAQVRGNMYAVIASRPLMEVSEYIELYWNTYNQQTDTVFMNFMRERFFKSRSQQVNIQRTAPKVKTDALEPKCEEQKYLDLINLHEPLKLDDVKEISNSNCWYIDYILDKVLTKANKSVAMSNCEVKNEMSRKTDVKVGKFKDFSGMSLEQIMAKIEVNEDMDSIANFIDIRLARLVPQIKNTMILSGIRGFGRHIPSCTKRLRMKRYQLKSNRKLYYVTVATHKTTTESLLNSLNLVAVCSGHTKELEKLGYDQNILCTASYRLYQNLLARHTKKFKGHKMFAVETLPEETDEHRQMKVETDLEDEWAPLDLYMEKEWSLFESSIQHH